MSKTLIHLLVLAPLALPLPASAEGLFDRFSDIVLNPPVTACRYTTSAMNWLGEKLLGDAFGTRRTCPLDGGDCVDPSPGDKESGDDAPSG